MANEQTPAAPSGKGNGRKTPSRKLKPTARLRATLWNGVHNVLATDALWSGALIVAIVLVLGMQSCGHDYERFQVGQRVGKDVKAVADFEFVDALSTEKERAAAVAKVLEIYDHDIKRGSVCARQLSELFAAGREALQQATLQQEDPQRAVQRALGEQVSPLARSALIGAGFGAALESQMTAALIDVLNSRVVTGRAMLKRGRAITVRRIPGGVESTEEEVAAFIDLNEARSRVQQQLVEGLDLPRAQAAALGELGASFVDANVTLNSVATEERRQLAASSVRSVIRRVQQGEVLARAGEPLTQDVIDTIDAARGQSSERLGIQGLLGLLFLASTFAFFLYRYTRYHQRNFRKIQHLHALIVLVTLSMLGLSSGILWVARGIVENLKYPFNQLESYAYLIPLGAGAVLVALLANGRIATVYSGFLALLFGAANGWDAQLMVWAMLVQCAGVYAIATYRDRAALLRAGLVVGSAGALTALALHALHDKQEPLSQGLYGAGLAFVGGAIGAGLLISFTLPILERLFNVLTDIRLLELSNVNNPLLSELMIKAPGSYNHSLVVGTLAEEAARAIGANSLFCRVAAFYHDIGKINKAEYFVENQRGTNPHDRLSPSMSALVIAAHVKDGIKMAREAGLPEQIIDIIPQHHGTKLMTYFYEKAKSNADPSLGPVKEEDFRYPGPKPQTREAAIFMLADGVEAAARTIDEPTANRLKEMIRKITNAVVLDGELDACDLTFSDLEKIQQAFLRSLVSMYHHRVDYPGFDFGKPKGETRERRGEGRTEPSSPDRKAVRGS